MVKVAGGEIHWKGRKFNWGDEVPDDLVAEHPEWVIDKPLTEAEIVEMTPEEAKDALLRLVRGEEPTVEVDGEVGAVGEVNA